MVRHKYHASAALAVNKLRAFTLLEVMVALIVFSVSALVLVKHANESVRRTGFLEAKVVATWAAENKLTELSILQNWPAVGRQDETVTMLQREWLVTTEVSGTDSSNLRRVDVRISTKVHDNTLVHLIGYIGRY